MSGRGAAVAANTRLVSIPFGHMTTIGANNAPGTKDVVEYGGGVSEGSANGGGSYNSGGGGRGNCGVGGGFSCPCNVLGGGSGSGRHLDVPEYAHIVKGYQLSRRDAGIWDNSQESLAPPV